MENELERFVKLHPTMWEDLFDASKYLYKRHPILSGSLKRYSDEIKEIDFNRPFNPFVRNKQEFFKITSVSRDDLESLGYNTKNLSNETMEELAQKMCDDYLEQLFWNSLETIADIMNIPKKGGNNESNAQ